jgi:hypothetical protein
MTESNVSIRTPEELQARVITVKQWVVDASKVATECWTNLELEWLNEDVWENLNGVRVYPGKEFHKMLESEEVINSVLFIFIEHGWIPAYKPYNKFFVFKYHVYIKLPLVVCPVPESNRNWNVPNILTPENLANARETWRNEQKAAKEIAPAAQKR